MFPLIFSFFEREREIDLEKKCLLVASHTRHEQGLNLQPRHVPRPGIKPATFWYGMMLQSTESPRQGTTVSISLACWGGRRQGDTAKKHWGTTNSLQI